MVYSTGELHYSINPYKLILSVDNEIARCYRALIPKYLKVKNTLYPAHISVVRNVVPPNLEFWDKYDCKEISFQYEDIIYNDELYYWLNAYSPQLESIRLELGLKRYGDVTWSPDGRHKFHITIGNVKGS